MIRIAAHIRPAGSASYHALREVVRTADQLGVDYIFGNDHFHPPSVSGLSTTGEMVLRAEQPDTNNFESWTALASWAEITRHCKLGVLVSCAAFRNADLLADMVRTVDHISGGRAVLGVGAGWHQRDFDSYGYEFGTTALRSRQLADTLQRVKARLPKLRPAPIDRIPILIGGAGERRTIPLVATYADIWHVPVAAEDQLKRKLDRLAAYQLEREAQRHIEIAVDWNDEESAQCYAALGASIFTVPLDADPDYDLSPLLAALDWRQSTMKGQQKCVQA
jgi:probable F420-dependent oxidoreductase